jgi:cytochrome c
MLELRSTYLLPGAVFAKFANARPIRRSRYAIVLAAIARALPLFLLVIVASPTTALAQSAAGHSKATPASTAADRKVALIDTGRIVFNQRCEVCHFIDSNAQKIGPGLKGLFARTRLADGTKITESTIANVVSEGGKDMPGYQGVIRPGQIQALIAYLKSH